MFSTKISALRVSLIQAGNLKKVQVNGTGICYARVPGFQGCVRNFSVLNKKSVSLNHVQCNVISVNKRITVLMIKT